MVTNPTPRLGPIVGEHMRRQGLSELEVSTAAPIPRTTLRRSLTGTRPFGADELHSLALVLGTTASALMAEAEREVSA